MSLADRDLARLYLSLQLGVEKWGREAGAAPSPGDHARCTGFASGIRWAIAEVDAHQTAAFQRFREGRGPTITRALASAVSDFCLTRGIPQQDLANSFDDNVAYELFRIGEYEPTLTEVFRLASVLKVSPDALVASSVMRLELLGQAGRDILVDYVGLRRLYVLELPGNESASAHGMALYHWRDCFRIGRALNREREERGEPQITHIAVFALTAEVPLT